MIEDRLAEADFVLDAWDLFGDRRVWQQVASRFAGAHMTTSGALWRQPAPRWLERMGALQVLKEMGYGTPLDWWEAESTIWLAGTSPRWRGSTMSQFPRFRASRVVIGSPMNCQRWRDPVLG